MIEGCMSRHLYSSGLFKQYNLTINDDLTTRFSESDCVSLVKQVKNQTLAEIQQQKLPKCMTERLSTADYLDTVMFAKTFEKLGKLSSFTSDSIIFKVLEAIAAICCHVNE